MSSSSASDQSGTWHYGLIARWWSEFNVAEPRELDYYRRAIEEFGQPVLDLGCGTGRILLPLVAEGFDVDGSDISPDMIAAARAKASSLGLDPTLTVEAMHEFEAHRTYRTIYMCGSLGIGGRRDHDREAVHRAYRNLAPGGALLITDHELPYGRQDEGSWALWLPGRRNAIPREWPATGDRRLTSSGDEIELLSRTAELNPLEQRRTLEMRARLWREGKMVKEEGYSLRECWYFAPEIRLVLDEAGFRDVAVEGNYTGRPATPDDGFVAFVARR